ncbi:MAG: lipoyl(octanoyl) transferase LipB [Legionellales bacterium]|jgi:lipoyl(octanoyl) transferase|nr:lipoyl(octanoyl) transferase LipB [Legionellales bacterium]
MDNNKKLIVRTYSSLQDYSYIFAAMQQFTADRQDKPDEIWLLQHKPTYTQGLAGKPEHIKRKLPFPLVKTDRGGQVTFHDAGQIMCYLLIDIKRKNLSIIDLINKTESLIIAVLKDCGITATQNSELGRGIYIGQKKIASIGLKVKKYCSYHGFALNFATDITAFTYINPCGISNLQMTNIHDYENNFTPEQIHTKIIQHGRAQFEYDTLEIIRETNDVCTTK